MVKSFCQSKWSRGGASFRSAVLLLLVQPVATFAAAAPGKDMAVQAVTPPIVDRDSSIETHLRAGLELWQAGEHARARQLFESILWIDELPPDLHAQADVYADAAQAYLAGKRLLPSGYAVATIGNYREVGSGADLFGAVRIGGRINAIAARDVAVNASLDYRFRRYTPAVRRNESDLRWNLNFSKPTGATNVVIGVRGWASYRGDGITRNDAGVFTTVRFRSGEDDQFTFGGELRRRSYPESALRYRSRNIVEGTASWSHAIGDGSASFTLAAHGGREFPFTQQPDGNTNFFGLSPSVNLTVTDSIGVFVYGWWQNNRYAVERFGADSGDDVTVLGRRNDDLFEAGGGITWQLAPGWEINPGFLYLRDRSNIPGLDYEAIELTMSLRRDF